MSVRTNGVKRFDSLVDHVTIRGTSISTSFTVPSCLHVTVVHTFGLPNRHGIIACDDYLVHLRFDVKNDTIVWVWASPVVDEEPWNCIIS